MIFRELTQQEIKTAPHLVWNAFVDLLAFTDHECLAPEQRPAHWVFWYESEVQNGGHFQYFENRGTVHLGVTLEALELLGATCQQRVLQAAGALWLSDPRPPVETVDEFCEQALEGEFDSYDARFHDCSPSLLECLETHLQHHRDLFVRVLSTD